MSNNMKNAGESGFTLIELMVVIVILGILAGFVVPNFWGTTDEAKVMRAKADIVSIETALKMYKLHNGVFPTTEEGLMALIERPASAKNFKPGGYLDKAKVPKDPWGNPYVYISPGTRGDFEIISYGADGVPNGEGINEDINNWDIE